MPSIGRYLITSCDERTWKTDRPVIFIGDWCLTENRNDFWGNLDAKIAEPYGLRSCTKDFDISQCREIEKQLFPTLCKFLNEYHGTKYSTRFWKIVLGHWFRRHIEIVYNRIASLQKCIASYQINGLTIYSSSNAILAHADSNSFIIDSANNSWNKMLEARILSLSPIMNLDIEVVPFDTIAYNEDRSKIVASLETENHPYRKIRKTFTKLSNLFLRENDAVIVSSYLPRIDEIKLYLRLFQFPQIWEWEHIRITESIDQQSRTMLCTKMENFGETETRKIISHLAFETMPICYLEGFKSMLQKIESMRLPKNPKFIFTSNGFDTNELFKIWTALQTEGGRKYIVGQHGNMYGTDRWFQNTIEEETSDKFLTWGWKGNLLQHTPAFIFKIPTHSRKSQRKKQILLVQRFDMVRDRTWDESGTFKEYFREQNRFLETLAPQPRDNVLLRLHPAINSSMHNEVKKWRDYDSLISIEIGSRPIYDLFNESALIVHTYDSTGLLETLSMNLPTIAFWSHGLEHLVEVAIPYYELLVDVGILHFSASSASKKINLISPDIHEWWAQSDVQEARMKFCNQFARTQSQKSKKIKSFLIT